MFFLRFLALDDAQFGHLQRYLASGRPVIGLRTSTHAFRYPAEHPRAAWNEDFGRGVLGTHYLRHMQTPTECRRFEQAKAHPILSGLDDQPFSSPGQLYIVDLEPGCVLLVIGRGEAPREQVVNDRFRIRLVARTESDIVAWTWQNRYGARVFATTLGHPQDFAVPQIMRLVVKFIGPRGRCPTRRPRSTPSGWRSVLTAHVGGSNARSALASAAKPQVVLEFQPFGNRA